MLGQPKEYTNKKNRIEMNKDGGKSNVSKFSLESLRP